jgi:hypothetical protein
MQFNTNLDFCPKQILFSFEKYAEVHMHMNGRMNKELGCYTIKLNKHFDDGGDLIIYVLQFCC